MTAITIVKHNSAEGSITLSINGQQELYSVKNSPGNHSQLVRESRQDILGKLCIDALVSNLQNAADLMFLAYNALAGTAVQSKVSALQKSLLDVSGDCMNTLDIFGRRGQEVAATLIKIYNLLLQGKDRLAIIQFKYCGRIARDMANESGQLAERIAVLGSESELVNQDAINLIAMSQSEKAEMTKKLNQLKAEQAAAEVRRRELADQMEKLTREYYASVEKLKDGWFVGAIKTVASAVCGVRDHNKEALRETHETYNRTSQEYNQLILQNLRDLQTYAAEIMKAQSGLSEAAKAVETFHYARRALAAIVSTLSEATLFWRSIQTYCEQLEKSSFSNAVHDYQGEFTPEELIEQYSSPEFIVMFVKNLSQWVALDNVCQEYYVAARNTYNKVSANIAASPSIFTAKEQTPRLAKQIFDSLDQQKKALEEAAEKDRRWGNYLTILNAKS
jgi:FtsZ-binding cell division protein ZapB